jgi:hypothetical protein
VHRPKPFKAPTSQTFSRNIHVIFDIHHPHPNIALSHPQSTHTTCSAVGSPSVAPFNTRANTCTAPPQPSKRELEIAEAQTLTDIKWTAASAVVLYLCELAGYDEVMGGSQGGRLIEIQRRISSNTFRSYSRQATEVESIQRIKNIPGMCN